ncbi:MAG: GGDEF domain-containing protein [Fusobacteriota bacterium]
MNNIWKERIKAFDFAFQPIVNTYSGVTYGYEALLRNWKELGFNSIDNVFNTAYNEKILYQLDLALRKKAMIKFMKIKKGKKLKLFYNLDNRVLEMPDYSVGNTSDILDELGLSSNCIFFEISEKHKFDSFLSIKNTFNIYKQQNYNIAIDDFGTGFSGLELLYHTEPALIKIDRFFIEFIQDDLKKKTYISNIIKMAHSLGIKIIAEGVETKEEFYACKNIGCDLIQGYYVQRPQLDISKLKFSYEKIKTLNKKDRRKPKIDISLIKNSLKYIPTININSPIKDVLDLFKKESKEHFFPVLNDYNEPMGIIRENEIKKYVYSPYGTEILLNKMKGETLKKILKKASVAEISMKIERLLNLFSINDEDDGIIITENGKYKGFLSATSLLKIINQKNIEKAQDQNPLTKLPGNNLIKSFIEEAISDLNTSCLLIYFDFDNFKPFNDNFGFRQGDRAIILFSELLKKYFTKSNEFIGHIGGDDFFLGINIESYTLEDYYALLQKIISNFEEKIRHFYSKKDLKRGYIISENRVGKKMKFPILSLSISLLFIPRKNFKINIEDVSSIMFQLKKNSKKSPDKISSASLMRNL